MISPGVIVVEDDADLRAVVARGLREEGFAVEAVGTGQELMQRMGDARPDALVLDIGLPDADGRDLCQALRARGVQVPVLFLTARDALPDRLAGFAAGGDDYLTKPFALDELIARLRVLVRRGGADHAARVGGLRLDPRAHAASCGGAPGRPDPDRVPAAGRPVRPARRGGAPARAGPDGLEPRGHRRRQHARRLRGPGAPQAAGAARVAGDRHGARGRLHDPVRRRLPRSLRARLLLAALVGFGAALLVATVGFNLLLRRSLSDDATRLAQDRAAATVATLEVRGGAIAAPRAELDGRPGCSRRGRPLERPAPAPTSWADG